MFSRIDTGKSDVFLQSTWWDNDQDTVCTYWQELVGTRVLQAAFWEAGNTGRAPHAGPV